MRAIESAVLDLCAESEAAIDFVDQDIEIIGTEAVARRASEWERKLAGLIASTRARRIATGKPTVFLVGPPNAGKSALFNRLGGSAIVSEVAGTTRDVICVETDAVRICDAPGLWQADGPVDARAARRAAEEAEHSDLWLFVVDASDPAPAEALAERARGRAAFLVLNKVDRVAKGLDVRRKFPIGEVLCTSATTGEGVGELQARLRSWASSAGAEAPGARFHVSLRQMGQLREAGLALRRAAGAAAQGLGMEFVALDLRAALMALGALTGRHANDDLLDRIFTRFCLGK